jgi:hypothetical protein
LEPDSSRIYSVFTFFIHSRTILLNDNGGWQLELLLITFGALTLFFTGMVENGCIFIIDGIKTFDNTY